MNHINAEYKTVLCRGGAVPLCAEELSMLFAGRAALQGPAQPHADKSKAEPIADCKIVFHGTQKAKHIYYSIFQISSKTSTI